MPAPRAAVSFREALAYWFKLGFISFGGPAGQIALMHQELVERRRWISEPRFLHALNYCMVLPGPEAQQLATYIGWLMHGVRGGLAAGVLFVLPSLLILAGLSWAYMVWGSTPAAAGILYGIKPAVTAIVLAAAWRIGTRTLRNASLIAIALAAFVSIYYLSAPFPLIVAAAAVLGLAGARWRPRDFDSAPVPVPAGASADVAAEEFLRVPDTAHARRTLVIACAIGLLLWAATLGVLAAVHGLHGTLPAMGWFFTKAALVTFGGAYAVLPYVVDAAVSHHQWLTAAQMLDGLALGETTPGPLIMVVAFVGFVGAWNHPVSEVLAYSGWLGALVATWFTFLPSFVFIFAGAPFVEATRRQPRIGAALTGVTAAVVGVIANLGVFFALHVFWPRGAPGGLEWPALLIAIAALAALVRLKANVIHVIVACALAGLLAHWLRLPPAG